MILCTRINNSYSSGKCEYVFIAYHRSNEIVTINDIVSQSLKIVFRFLSGARIHEECSHNLLIYTRWENLVPAYMQGRKKTKGVNDLIQCREKKKIEEPNIDGDILFRVFMASVNLRV